MHGVACGAQHDSLITRAVGAARLSASKALASHLLICLLDLPKAVDGVGAAADVFTCVQWLSDMRMPIKRYSKVRIEPLLLLG